MKEKTLKNSLYLKTIDICSDRTLVRHILVNMTKNTFEATPKDCNNSRKNQNSGPQPVYYMKL